MTNVYLIMTLKHKSSDAVSGIYNCFDCFDLPFTVPSLQTKLYHRYVYIGEYIVYTYRIQYYVSTFPWNVEV